MSGPVAMRLGVGRRGVQIEAGLQGLGTRPGCLNTVRSPLRFPHRVLLNGGQSGVSHQISIRAGRSTASVLLAALP